MFIIFFDRTQLLTDGNRHTDGQMNGANTGTLNREKNRPQKYNTSNYRLGNVSNLDLVEFPQAIE